MSDQADVQPANMLPRKTTGDYAHVVVKAALSVIPIAGAPAAELFALVLAPPLDRRRDAWLEDLYKSLKQLEARFENFHIEELQQNESFISAAMQATRAAIATHQQEKRAYLRNALLNIAIQRTPEEDQIQMYLRYVEELCVWHVRFLRLFQAPRNFLMSQGVRFNVLGGGRSRNVFNYTAGSPSLTLEMAFPELQGKQEFYGQIANDLRVRGMLNSPIEFLHTTMSSQGMLDKRTTNAADDFLEFINDPFPE